MTTPTSRLRRSSTSEGCKTRAGNSYQPGTDPENSGRYGLESRYDRLREVGYLTVELMAKLLGIAAKTVQERRKRRLLKGVRLNDLHEYLYEYLGVGARTKKVRATELR